MADGSVQLASGGIEIRHLYKIFGPQPEAYVDAVRQGMSKAELNVEHGHVLGLKDINIHMAPGGIHVIMGLSGSGKSTLIRHINRLIEPTSGEVLVDGADVIRMSPAELRAFRRQKTAMVFQTFALLPHRTVIDNVVYGLEVQGLARKAQVETGMRWIERVGLKGFEKSYPNQLSGGMRQRVGLARALANDAPILLMDEAFSALDPLIRTDMQTVLLDIQEELQKIIVFITHDLDEALRLGDQIAILRDGEIIQKGTSQDIVLNPADDYIANFVREVNRARVVQVRAVMAPFEGGQMCTHSAIPAGTTLEDALRRLVEAPERNLPVTDENGRPIGQVNLRQIATAIATPISTPASIGAPA